ncbi:MAG: Uma2 family endonuclease [Planctomycetes bacterium]|nr:Uma2 family endonuclease [Planctomycetota bacterium]
MSLDDFARAEGEPGHRYELGKGEVVVVDVPGLPHGLVVQNLDREFRRYDLAHPGRIVLLAAGSDCALRLPGMQSERHPDLSLYLTPPPELESPWEEWIPDLVVEVTSKGQESRDYDEKRQEYLAAGVRAYWIVDPGPRAVLLLRRRGDAWREDRAAEAGVLRTLLLPGLEIKVSGLFAKVSPRRARKGKGDAEPGE